MQKLAFQIGILCLMILSPLSTQSLKYIPLGQSISIKIQKSSPPYQAFKAIRAPSSRLPENTEYRVEQLSAENTHQQTVQSYKKIVLLEPLVIKDLPRVQITESPSEHLDLDWIQSLPLRQRVRLEEAQARYSLLEDIAKDNSRQKAVKNEETYDITITRTPTGYSLRGPIEMAGGLALTQEHFIDLRRSIEGQAKEAGEVSIKEGLYSIHVDSLYGDIVAKMFDDKGQVLGEGQLALNEDMLESRQAYKLIIKPQKNGMSGTPYSTYDSNNRRKPPDGLATAFLNGDLVPTKNPSEDHFDIAALEKRSQTLGRFEAPEFVPSNMLVYSGVDFQAPMFPRSMIKALKEIVSEQLHYDLNSPEVSVIWGQVKLSGKPAAGARVDIESDDKAYVVYFDELNLPDSKLKETSSNGYYAILGAPEGFHALIARRGEEYFAHNTAIVETGSVSVVDLESTLRTRHIPLRVFDAFTGKPKSADLEMQSVEVPVHVDERGWTTLLLPEIHRLSLLRLNPGEKYLPAQYFYSDDQTHIHLPVIDEQWLMEILKTKWSQIDSDKGTLIGFFPEENFEVYIAGAPDFPVQNITYFDANGEKTETGVKGGGFIVNNLNLGVQEVVAFGKESELIYSRVLPVDQRSLSVVSF